MYLCTTGDRLSKKGFFSTPEGSFDLQDIRIETENVGRDQYLNLIHLDLVTADQTFRFEGKVLSLLPLRNRKEGRIVWIAEGITEWHWENRVGYGLSEYLDHI
jgi:hypothetical protein